MRFIVSNVDQFKALMNGVEAITDTANISISNDGLKVRSMDPIRVAMVDLHLPISYFDVIQVPENELVLGVNFEELGKIMERGKGSESLEVIHDEKKLKFIFTRKGAKRTFSLTPLDLGKDDLPIPKIDFSVHGKLVSSALVDAVKDASVVSDQMWFEGDAETLSYGAATDENKVLGEFRKGSELLLDLDISESAKATYALNYMGDIVKVSGAFLVVLLEFKTNMPLSLTYEIPSGGYIKYYLAPRREAE